VAELLPNDVRVIIGLEPLDKRTATNGSDDETSGNNCKVISETNKNPRRNGSNSANVTLGQDEVSFERGLYLSYT
jgi:hypothetical protein